ncbi:MAG: hypothetical protein Q4B90_07515 [Eubacteriales bacterium]|nr:hypothetical protein [Eubacteriales bacterium]
MNDSGFNNVLKKSPPFWGYHIIEMSACPVYSINYKKFYTSPLPFGDEQLTKIKKEEEKNRLRIKYRRKTKRQKKGKKI